MNTKELIKFCVIELGEHPTEYYDKYFNQIINLLKRGEKFEEMWEEITVCAYKYRDVSNNYTHLVDLMEEIKQKYFPKTVKKTITIEFESDIEKAIESNINLMKAYLERTKHIPPKVKYTIKEGD